MNTFAEGEIWLTVQQEGMVLMDNCLYDLYCRCQISYDTALSRARIPEHIIKRTGE